MFNNIPPVTKNILLLNVVLFFATMMLAGQGVDLYQYLSGRYFNSALFQPYQIVTHMFMHGSIMHIFFNMFALVIFGGHLERVWGPKRFFIFYIATGLGAFVLYNGIGVWEIMQLKETLISEGYNLSELNAKIIENGKIQHNPEDWGTIVEYGKYTMSSLVGASGAVFGLLAAFAILFPNTELMLLFPPIPIKAKYLIGGYIAYEVYNSIYNSGDTIAHLAHVGGAVVGAIMVLYWRKKGQNFW